MRRAGGWGNVFVTPVLCRVGPHQPLAATAPVRRCGLWYHQASARRSGPLSLGVSRRRPPETRLPPHSIFGYHLFMAADFRDVDPAELRLPPSRFSGADPYKLQRQIARFGASTVGMPPVWVYEGSDGVLEIRDAPTADRGGVPRGGVRTAADLHAGGVAGRGVDR